jgi:hypothetical protein
VRDVASLFDKANYEGIESFPEPTTMSVEEAVDIMQGQERVDRSCEFAAQRILDAREVIKDAVTMVRILPSLVG